MTVTIMRTGNARFFPLLVVAALASYWLFPDYLVLLTQIFVLATFALSYDLLQGFAALSRSGTPRSSASAPTPPR